MGSVYCELEQNIDIDSGRLKTINISKDLTSIKPDGLDSYFYAVDYIVAELSDEAPYSVFNSEEGKIIILNIGNKPDKRSYAIQIIRNNELAFPIVSRNIALKSIFQTKGCHHSEETYYGVEKIVNTKILL